MIVNKYFLIYNTGLMVGLDAQLFYIQKAYISIAGDTVISIKCSKSFINTCMYIVYFMYGFLAFT